MPKVKKIFIFLGHPDAEPTLNSALADAYESGAKEAGHEVRRLNLSDITFDPILHRGYKVIQELEPGLLQIQENIAWADHFVLLYPNWWSGMPALLKGMFDRMFLPGFAFNFYKKTPFFWGKLLKGKTARVIITTDGVPFLYWFVVGNNTNEIRKGILRFAGFKARVKKIWMVKFMNKRRANRLLRKMERLGKRAR